MTTFQEFLRKKAPAEFDPAIRHDRDEWLADLLELRDVLKGWVKELDPDGYLLLRDREYPKFDRRLGRFYAPGLEVGLGETRVEIEPGPRNSHQPLWPIPTAGQLEVTALGASQGTAVIRGPGYASYTLHRFRPSDRPVVWLFEERPAGFRGTAPLPLNCEQFALVLQDLLA